MKPIILVGGGGHCKACIDVIEAQNEFRIVGIVESNSSQNSGVLGYPVIGRDENISELIRSYPHFLITIGQIQSAVRKRDLYLYVRGLGATFPLVVSPRAHVSTHARVEAGTVVMHNAVVNAGTEVGENCIVNTGAIIEHDAQVGPHCHVSTGATVNGGCVIEEGCFIGSGSTIIHGVRVARGSLIGAGAVVVDSILESGTYVGQPARRIRTSG